MRGGGGRNNYGGFGGGRGNQGRGGRGGNNQPQAVANPFASGPSHPQGHQPPQQQFGQQQLGGSRQITMTNSQGGSDNKWAKPQGGGRHSNHPRPPAGGGNNANPFAGGGGRGGNNPFSASQPATNTGSMGTSNPFASGGGGFAQPPAAPKVMETQTLGRSNPFSPGVLQSSHQSQSPFAASPNPQPQQMTPFASNNSFGSPVNNLFPQSTPSSAPSSSFGQSFNSSGFGKPTASTSPFVGGSRSANPFSQQSSTPIAATTTPKPISSEMRSTLQSLDLKTTLGGSSDVNAVEETVASEVAEVQEVPAEPTEQTSDAAAFQSWLQKNDLCDLIQGGSSVVRNPLDALSKESSGMPAFVAGRLPPYPPVAV